jgi:phosphate transport system protein
MDRLVLYVRVGRFGRHATEAGVFKHMQRDLEQLRRAVLAMAGLVEDAIGRATAALHALDPDAARAVIAADSAIDALENEVQEECLKVLALHQPVAADLRRVSTMLLISTDLERMGDLAVSIAERAVSLASRPMPIPDRLDRMAVRATDMVRRSLDAFVAEDAAAARAVIRLDDEVDRDNETAIAELVSEMKKSPDRVESGLMMFSAVRNLERIADHATNIAEDVVYLVEGEVLRHHPERG